jgi:DNA-binding LytR/AlgR family response regulator
MTEQLKILIVEDERIISMNLVSILRGIGYHVLKPVANYELAVKVLASENPDFVILDIQIDGEKSGIDIAKHIKSNYNIPFIYLTSNSDTITLNDAKATKPSAYLIKPFNKESLYTTIELAMSNFQDVVGENLPLKKAVFKDTIFIKKNHVFIKLKFQDILFIQSDHVYLKIQTVNKEEYSIRASFAMFYAKLPDNFHRVHRSYIVNLDYLNSINSVNVDINGVDIPIGGTYRKKLMSDIDITN